MDTPKIEKNTIHPLAEALTEAKKISVEGIIKASDLERSVKARLSAAGCLLEILKGWYLLTTPGSDGSSTAWFGSFWSFAKHYLPDRFGEEAYCLSAESSIDLYSGESVISNQVMVLTQKNSNHLINLPHDTSLFLYTDQKNFPTQINKTLDINVMALPLALSRLGPSYYINKPLNVEIALRLLPSVSELSRILLETKSIASANRLAGAFEALGDHNKAKQIEEDMASIGLALKPLNPFSQYAPTLQGTHKINSPYVGRIEALWTKMREPILKVFSEEPGLSRAETKTLKVIQELYSQDAYHSLSIEGYQVTEELIQKIAEGSWDPENNLSDQEQRNALAAKGYHQVFQAVLKSIHKLFQRKKSPAQIFEEDLQTWYRDQFSPLAQANLMKPSDLAGYRNNPVYIRNSRHIPPPVGAVVDSMEALFRLLSNEESAAVRAILGHFIFVYIHPYMDGNGRIARFLMNLMFISGGYHWTVIRLKKREDYMKALEDASVRENITPFAKVVHAEMKCWEKV